MRCLAMLIVLCFIIPSLAQDHTPDPANETQTDTSGLLATTIVTVTLSATPLPTETMHSTYTPVPPSPTSVPTLSPTTELTAEIIETEVTASLLTPPLSPETTIEVLPQFTAEATSEITAEATQEITTGVPTLDSSQPTQDLIVIGEVVEVTEEVIVENNFETLQEATIEITEEITEEVATLIPAEITAEPTGEVTIEPDIPTPIISVTPTATPGDIPLRFVQGIVRYQNRAENSGIAVLIYSMDGTLLSVTDTTDDGIFSVAAPDNQPYWLAANAPLHRYTRIFIDQETSLPTIILPGGDLNDDTCINQLDLNQLTTAFNQTNSSETDINADGITDASDLAILTGNFVAECESEENAIIEEPAPALEASVNIPVEETEESTPEQTEPALEVMHSQTPDGFITGGISVDTTAEATEPSG